MSFTPKEAISILSQKFLLQEGIAGVSHGSNVLKVYVESPEVAEKVPKSLMDFPVKVIVSGKFKALSLLQETLPEAKSGRTIIGLEASRTAKWRPCPGGASVAHYLVTAGTLSTRVYDIATGRKLFLSNNHVLAATNKGRPGDPILQPGPYDGGKLPGDQLGVLERFIELKPPPDINLVDASLGRPLREEDLSDEILDIGVIVGWEDPVVGMKVCKSGRTSGYTESTITDVNASIKVYYGEEYYVFENQIITGHMMDPGDSVVGDARMYYLENGNLKFGTVLDVFNSFKSGNEVEVLSVKKVCENYPNGYPSFKTGVVCFSKVADAIYHGIKPVWRVTLHNGKAIEITRDHSLFTVQSLSNTFVPKKLEELDRVVSVDDYGFEGIPLPYDDDLLTFLGLWLADGSYEKRDGEIEGLSISTGNDGELVKWLSDFTKKYRKSFLAYEIRKVWDENPSLSVKEVAEKVGCDYYTVWDVKSGRSKGEKRGTEVLSYKSKGDYKIWSIDLARTVYSLCGDVDCYTKRVPTSIFTATKSQIASFLKGYFSGDGSIHLHEDHVILDCASVNRGLLEDVQELLSRLGVKCNIDSGYIPTRFSKLRQYKLKIEGRIFVQKFLKNVGLIKKVNGEYLEVLSRQSSKIEKDYPFSDRGVRRVEFIGYKPVYDFKVNPSESFVANGILCHNSGSLLVNTATKRAVGLGFAGSDTLSCANKISNVLSMLNVSLSPTGAIVPPSPVTVPFQLAFIPVLFGAFISTYSMQY